MAPSIIEYIKSKLKEAGFKDKHKTRETDFQRKREDAPLGFEVICKFVLGMAGRKLTEENIDFGIESAITVSDSAISQRRDAVQYTAFEELFTESAKMIPAEQNYRGYRLSAYDGIKGELPNFKDLKPKYLASETAQYPTFHAVAEYDVLNKVYTQAVFEPGVTDERAAALKLIEKNSYAGKEIMLLDRGFPSIKMIQTLNKKGKFFVMRVSSSFLAEVNAFRLGTGTDEIIQVDYTKRRASLSKVKDIELPYSFDLRCVRIVLPSGEHEILVTNLPAEEFSTKDIGELYNLRWQIEIGFLRLKHAVRIEDFVGKKENSVLQEYFATLIKANILMQLAALSDAGICGASKKNEICIQDKH